MFEMNSYQQFSPQVVFWALLRT